MIGPNSQSGSRFRLSVGVNNWLTAAIVLAGAPNESQWTLCLSTKHGASHSVLLLGEPHFVGESMTIHDSLKSDTRCRMGHRSAKSPQNQWVPRQFDLPTFFAILAFKPDSFLNVNYTRAHCGTRGAILHVFDGPQWTMRLLKVSALLDVQWFKMLHVWCASLSYSFMVFFQSLSSIGKIELAPTAKVWLSTCTAPKAMLGQYNDMNGLGLKHQRSLKQLCFVVKPRIGVLPFHPADVGKLPGYFRNRFIIQMNHL